MKKYFQLGFLSLFLVSCSSYKRSKFDYRSNNNTNRNSNKQFFIKQFKDGLFYKCLKHGYGEDLNFQIGHLMARKDLFSPSEEPNPQIDSLQDNLSEKLMNNLPSPYIHVEDESLIKGKNFIISTCLSYYESREIDSIAKKLYKHEIKEDRKLWRGHTEK